MAIIGSLPSIIQNGQVVDASPLMADFNFIVNQVNANAQPASVPPLGTLLNIQTFGAGVSVYTPTAGTNSILVYLVGGGASGSGCVANNASQICVGSGGNGGTLAWQRFTSGFSGHNVTIGVGGAAVTGGVGNTGGNSSFLTLLAVGGAVGVLTQALTSGTASAGNNPGASSSGGIYNGGQVLGNPSIFVQNQGFIVGAGGNSPLGGGAGLGIFNSNGGPGTAPGAGGGGTATGPSQAAVAGGAGSAGIGIIYEFS